MMSPFKNTGLLALTLSLSLMIPATSSIAEVYKTVNEDGSVIFSDQSNPKAKTVEIQSTNTVKAVKASNVRAPQPTKVATKAYKITINSPDNDTVIANGLVPFTVSTSVSPSLKEGHQLQLSIDGNVHSKGQTKNIVVESILRGEHQLRVSVIDADGKVISQSAAVKVFAHRPSSASSNSRGPVNLPNRPGINPPPSRPGGGSRR